MWTAVETIESLYLLGSSCSYQCQNSKSIQKWSWAEMELGSIIFKKANEGSELQLWDRLGQQLLSPDVGKCCLPWEIIMNGTAAQIPVFKIPSPYRMHVRTRVALIPSTPHTGPQPQTQWQATGHLLACIKIKSIPWNLYFSWGQSSILGKPESAKFISLSWNSDI